MLTHSQSLPCVGRSLLHSTSLDTGFILLSLITMSRGMLPDSLEWQLLVWIGRDAVFPALYSCGYTHTAVGVLCTLSVKLGLPRRSRGREAVTGWRKCPDSLALHRGSLSWAELATSRERTGTEVWPAAQPADYRARRAETMQRLMWPPSFLLRK